jgi:hypothetical protein
VNGHLTSFLTIAMPMLIGLLSFAWYLGSRLVKLEMNIVGRDRCDEHRRTCPARIELGIEHTDVRPMVDRTGGA